MVERKFPRDFIPLSKKKKKKNVKNIEFTISNETSRVTSPRQGQNQGEDTAALRTMKETVASS